MIKFAKDIRAFAATILTLNPRVRRGFLESYYTMMVWGEIVNLEAGAIEELARLLIRFGFTTTRRRYSTTLTIETMRFSSKVSPRTILSHLSIKC